MGQDREIGREELHQWVWSKPTRPKRAIRWLKHVRSPGRDGQLSAGTDEMPQFPHCARHVGNKEDSENTYDSVKTLAWIIQGQHIRTLEADILQKTVLGFCPRQLQKLIGQINSDDQS